MWFPRQHCWAIFLYPELILAHSCYSLYLVLSRLIQVAYPSDWWAHPEGARVDSQERWATSRPLINSLFTAEKSHLGATDSQLGLPLALSSSSHSILGRANAFSTSKVMILGQILPYGKPQCAAARTNLICKHTQNIWATSRHCFHFSRPQQSLLKVIKWSSIIFKIRCPIYHSLQYISPPSTTMASGKLLALKHLETSWNILKVSESQIVTDRLSGWKSPVMPNEPNLPVEAAADCGAWTGLQT